MSTSMLVFAVYLCLQLQTQIASSVADLSSDQTRYVIELSADQVVEVDAAQDPQDLTILCTSGQEISPRNALMSSYLILMDSPTNIDIFADQNQTKIIEHFKRSNWMKQMTNWFDSSSVTNLMVRSFSQQCIGIVSKNTIKVQLSVKTIDSYRVFYLTLGLLLFLCGHRISRNQLFYYISCITIGTFASFLLIFLIVGRYFPRKISGVLILLGSSAIMCAFEVIITSFRRLLIEYSHYLFIYGFTSAFISFALAYRLGPIVDHKTFNLLQWLLQIIGLILIVLSSEIVEYSSLVVMTIIVIKNIPDQGIFSIMGNKVEYKLMTESEYELQSDVQTKKSLEELKEHCLGSDCKAWNMVCKLKDPIRFARFVNGDNHLTDQEIEIYENSDHNRLIELSDSGDDTDSATNDSEVDRRAIHRMADIVMASDI